MFLDKNIKFCTRKIVVSGTPQYRVICMIQYPEHMKTYRNECEHR